MPVQFYPVVLTQIMSFSVPHWDEASTDAAELLIFLLHHSFSPLNADPSLFNASCFSVLSPFCTFWNKPQEVTRITTCTSFPLINSGQFSVFRLPSFCLSLQEEKTPVRRSTWLPLSYFFFPLSRSECIPCISNKWSRCLWFKTCLNFDFWKNIQRNVFPFL